MVDVYAYCNKNPEVLQELLNKSSIFHTVVRSTEDYKATHIKWNESGRNVSRGQRCNELKRELNVKMHCRRLISAAGAFLAAIN